MYAMGWGLGVFVLLAHMLPARMGDGLLFSHFSHLHLLKRSKSIEQQKKNKKK
jgi:hypothetical protein